MISDAAAFEFWVSLLFLPSLTHSELKQANPERSPSGVPCPGVCLVCGQPVRPTWDNVQRTLQPCAYCAGTKLDAAVAEGKVLALGTCEPLEPYPGSANRWLVKCLECGEPRYSSYNIIVNQRRGVCAPCGLRRGGQQQRIRNLKECLSVLSDGRHDGYLITGHQVRTRSGRSRLMLDIRCPVGHEYQVESSSWKSGSRCSSCLERGFRPESPAHVYAVAGGGWLKVGISNDGSLDRRLQQHAQQGLNQVLHLVTFDRGANAQSLELHWKAVLVSNVPPEDRATGRDLVDGFSETVRDCPAYREWIASVLLPLAADFEGLAIPVPFQLCDVVPCGKVARLRGTGAMCPMHETRMRVHGSPFVVLTARRQAPADGACRVAGCSRPHVARGMCRYHYQQWWRSQGSNRSK